MKTAVLVYLDVVGDSAYGRPMDGPPRGNRTRKAMDVRNDDDEPVCI